LGASNPSSWRDLTWWLSKEVIQSILEIRGDQQSAGSDTGVWSITDLEADATFQVDRTRIVGYTSASCVQLGFENSRKTARQFPEDWSEAYKTESQPNTCLAWDTFASSSDLYTRHLFMGFMWAVAPF